MVHRRVSGTSGWLRAALALLCCVVVAAGLLVAERAPGGSGGETAARSVVALQPIGASKTKAKPASQSNGDHVRHCTNGRGSDSSSNPHCRPPSGT